MLLERHRVSCLELLEGYLDTEGVAYTIDEHPPRYTAQELAQVEHVSGRLIAKAVMVVAGGTPVMVVVPGVAKVTSARSGRRWEPTRFVWRSRRSSVTCFPIPRLGPYHRSGISTACLCSWTRRWRVTR